jgi:hypothetical protein
MLPLPKETRRCNCQASEVTCNWWNDNAFPLMPRIFLCSLDVCGEYLVLSPGSRAELEDSWFWFVIL